MSLGIGEPFLAAALQEIFKTLGSSQVRSFFGDILGGPGVEEWRPTLRILSALLSDAEMKKIKVQSVKEWLSEVNDLVYDMEDMLDKIFIKELQRKDRLERHSLAGRILNSSPSLIFKYDLRSRIHKTTSRLNHIVTVAATLNLVKSSNEGPSSSNPVAYLQRPESSSVPNESEVFGRDEDIAALLNMVLRVEANNRENDNFDVIGIVGMTGIGKTTLAKQVYNNAKVMEDFHLYAWVHVSHHFEPKQISRGILATINSLQAREWITSTISVEGELVDLQIRLQHIVDGKKFLFVLDDVWSHDYALWKSLKSPFRSAAPGSKIIITTQNEDVARGMGSSSLRVLDSLEDDACLSLFKKHAFYNRHEDQNWMKTDVVKRCGGLPLAAIALADVLRSKQRGQWSAILRSELWDLPAQSGIHTALEMSYYDLPSHLKRCFAYCSIFPKSYQFEEQELKFLWMAEGLIGQPEDRRTPEELGSEYLQDLVSRSIFRQAGGDGSKFLMHDLYHDLARWASGETTFRLESESTSTGQSRRLGKNARRLSYTSGEFDGNNKFQVLLHEDEKQVVKRLRTFLPIVLDSSPRYISRLVLFRLLRRLERLRVLSLQGYCITTLPDSIGDMAYLRHLNLSGCLIRRLPKSTTSLYNLQTLILRNCRNLEELPSDIEKLSNLLHLDIRGAISISKIPPGIKKLTSLRMLSDFIIGRDTTGPRLGDLRDLRLLRGELRISKLEEVVDYQDARDVLRHNQDLKVLELKWGSQSGNSNSVLDMLQPHECMEKLTINGYGGIAFPSWVGQSQLCNLATLRLEDCRGCTSLPPLGLLRSLKNLSIIMMSAITSIGPEIYGDCQSPFPSLETLEIRGLQNWTRWDPIDENEGVRSFSCLRKLSIIDCFEFSEQLPDNLPLLEELEVEGCPSLEVSVSRLDRLRTLKLRSCQHVVIPFSGLREVSVENCPSMVVSGSVAETDSLQTLSISGKSKLYLLSIRMFQQVRYLEVMCPAFMKLLLGIQKHSMRRGMKPNITLLTSLTELKIQTSLRDFVTFPEVHFLPNLRKLEITYCDSLSYLSEGIKPEGIKPENAGLKYLKISNCSSLSCIFRNQLPSSLKRISVEGCHNLKYVLDDSEGTSASASSSSSSQQSTALKRLQVRNCSELETLFSRGQLPNTLEHIDIDDCSSLKSVVERFNAGSSLTYIRITKNGNLDSIPEGLHNLGCLQDIIIQDCPKLGCFPGELPNTTARVSIKNCEKLEALPLHFHTLNSLEKLEVGGFRKITRFPEQGLPNSLTSLTLEDLEPNFYHQMGRWGLHRLASLTYLSIGGWLDAVSFPQKKMKLPTSLTHLIIKNFPKLECLSASGFLHLTFLESLHIGYCPKLKCLPKEDLLSSLLQLHISDCRDLAKKMLDGGKGKYRSKIAFIPCVKVDGELL